MVQEVSLVFRYHSAIPLESAATSPLAAITATLSLFDEMGIPLLVWAGIRSVGQYPIPLAKSAGCFVISRGYLEELGADICCDYKDSNVVLEIKQTATEIINYAIDCVSEKKNQSSRYALHSRARIHRQSPC